MGQLEKKRYVSGRISRGILGEENTCAKSLKAFLSIPWFFHDGSRVNQMWRAASREEKNCHVPLFIIPARVSPMCVYSWEWSAGAEKKVVGEIL